MSALDLLTTVLFAALKVGVLVTLAAGLALSLRRAPAAARHGLWVATLTGALLLPVVTPWVPAWTLWTLPADTPAIESMGTERVAVVPDRPPPCAGCEATPSLTPEQRSGWQALSARLESVRARLSRVPAAAWLLALWLGGALLVLLRLTRSLAALGRLERQAFPAGPAWTRALARARERVGVLREVRLLESDRIRTPMTWGALRPIILLPEESRAWDEERRRIVLHHELSHVRRGDWLARLLAKVVCALYWLNPLVWLAGRRLVLEQEKACDEAVVALGDRPSSYARHLLAIAASLQPASHAPALALDMARRSQMEGRLMSILDGSRRSRSGRALLVPAMVLIGLVPALAAVEPWAEEQLFAVHVGPQVQDPEAGRAPDDGDPFESQRATLVARLRQLEQDRVAAADAAVGSANVDVRRVSAVLEELARLEREMEPFERELEAIEAEMEPIEADLEGVEEGLEPYETELEAFEAELEPFEARLEEVERELEPYEERLEVMEAELEPFEDRLDGFDDELAPYEERLESVELELAPYEERLQAIEAEMEPLERELDAVEDQREPFEDRLEALEDQMEPLDDEMDRLDDQYDAAESDEERARLREAMQEIRRKMEPIRQQMREVHQEMRPVHDRMRALHQEMQPYYDRMREVHAQTREIHQRMRDIHEEMRPVHERMRSVHEEMAPVHERMRAVHEEMRPVYERMREIHEEMGPVYERMGEVHERMRPVHEAMSEHHERMAPHHRKMGEIHVRMRPLYEEMAVHHQALETELVDVVEQLLTTELGGVVGSGTDFSTPAWEIVDHSSIRIDDGRLRIHSSLPGVREYLEKRFAADTASADFDAALKRFLDAYANLEIDAP